MFYENNVLVTPEILPQTGQNRVKKKKKNPEVFLKDDSLGSLSLHSVYHMPERFITGHIQSLHPFTKNDYDFNKARRIVNRNGRECFCSIYKACMHFQNNVPPVRVIS